MSETRKLAAILVADVVGYSRLAGADEDRTLARLRGLRSDLIDPAIAAHQGRIVKRTGDGSLVEFRSVVDAVRCAMEVQNGLIERNAGVPPERRIEFRVGIHLGDVVEESDGDLMGDSVNIAARLESICEPGAICLSEDAYRQVKARLDLAVNDLGPTQLKNIAEPIRVYLLDVGQALQAEHIPPSPATRKTDPPRLSIVVLPFKSLSSDPEDYFADGVTENLTTDLSRIRNSFVIARNTAFTFKGKAVDAKQIGKELGVRYVLEGSVQRDRNRVRVNAQLIDGETGAHLWADRFQEDVADLFKLQDDVVARLANALSHELVRAEAEKSARSKSPEAIDLIMRGRAALFQWAQRPTKTTSPPVEPGSTERSRSIRMMPMPWRAKPAPTWPNMRMNGRIPKPITTQKYSASPIDPSDSRVTTFTLTSRRACISLRPADALRVVNAGLAVNSNAASLYGVRSAAKTYLRQFAQARSDVEQAMRLSPRDPRIGQWHNLMADAEFGIGNLDAVIEEANKALDDGYRNFYSYLNLAAAHALKGDIDQAKASLAEARRLNPKLSVKWLISRKPVLQPAFDALRKTGLPDE